MNFKDTETGVWIHSQINPEKEADRFIESIQNIAEMNTLVFFGFGAGYHLDSLIKNNNLPKKVYCIEPVSEIFSHPEIKKKSSN